MKLLSRVSWILSMVAFSMLVTQCDRNLDSETKKVVGEVPQSEAKQCADKILAMKPSGTGRDTKIQEAFNFCLGAYVRIPTINTGRGSAHEDLAVDFLRHIFAKLQIPTRVITTPDLTLPEGEGARMSLVASLLPDGVPVGTNMPSLLFMNHLDVVHAHVEQWDKPESVSGNPTFSGQIGRIKKDGDDEDYLIGRGSLDMKNVGIMQLFAMALHKFDGLPLGKAVHFLALADEEQASSGAIGVLAEIREGGELEDLLSATVAFDEGGFGIQGILGAQSAIHLIGTDERGGAWLTIKNNSLNRLFDNLARLRLVYYQNNSILALRERYWRWMMGWDCSVDRIETKDPKVNVLPSDVEVDMSCRNRPTPADIDWAFNMNELGDEVRRIFGWSMVTPGLTLTSTPTERGVKISIHMAEAGHASSSSTLSALDVAGWGLQKIGALDGVEAYGQPEVFDYQLTPTMKDTLDALGRIKKEFAGITLPRIKQLGQLLDVLPDFIAAPLLKTIGGKAGIEKVFRTSCTLSSLQYMVNQGPASLMLDCRLINQRKFQLETLSHSEEFRHELEKLMNPDSVPSAERSQITLDQGWNYSSSPKDSVYFTAMKNALSEQFPGVEVAAFMTPGGTDSTYFRDPHNAGATAFPKGLPSYGFAPLLVNPKVMATFHNSNERFPVLQAVPAVKSYASLLKQLTEPQ